jgi:hypothetical protein
MSGFMHHAHISLRVKESRAESKAAPPALTRLSKAATERRRRPHDKRGRRSAV